MKIQASLVLAVAVSLASVCLAQSPAPSKKPVGAVHNAALAKQIKSAAAPASSPAAALDPLVAEVLVGSIKCELGRTVIVAANPKKPGHFNVSVGKTSFDMKPVATSSGALRMEDKARGGVWLQLGNKSMLMNEKLGQRIADDCIHPQHLVWIAEAKARPPGLSLFADAPAVAASGSALATASSAAASAPAPAASR